jgi:hypothetical protein
MMFRLSVFLFASWTFGATLSIGQVHQPPTNPLPCSTNPHQPFVAGCNLPGGTTWTHTKADDDCPLGGVSKQGTSENAQDLVKNNFCSRGPAQDITILQLAQLQNDTLKVLHVQEGTFPKDRSQLANAKALAFHEKDLVRLKAYVRKAETADIALGESGESVNCNISRKSGCSLADSVIENDIHVALVATANEKDECMSVTAENTPHMRPDAWSEPDIQGLEGKLVRVSGQLMFDGSHYVCADDKAGKESPPRQSSWEIHPVYSVEVCQQIVNNDCAEQNWKPLQ